MSFSEEYTDYCLTDKGWIIVKERVDFSVDKQVNPEPEKFYMKCRYSEGQSSPYSEMYKGVRTISEDENEKEKIQELIKKYGTCPQSL